MTLSEEQALKRLKAKATAVSQKALAAELDISPSYLGDVLHGRRDPAHVLARFGLRRIVRYEAAT